MAESLEKYFRQFELEKPRNRLEAGLLIATKAFAVFLSALTIYWVFHILYVSGLLFVSCPSKDGVECNALEAVGSKCNVYTGCCGPRAVVGGRVPVPLFQLGTATETDTLTPPSRRTPRAE